MRSNIRFLLNFRLIIPKFKILHKKIVSWYEKNKRDLPWRKTKDPYQIWVSEIILQQTQIKTGTKYYVRFLNKYSNIKSLSQAKDTEVLKVWEGLGYYAWALNMIIAAKYVMTNYNGVFPTKYDKLIELKGVGEYTASAISSICCNEKRAVLDGNVYRVLSRVYNIRTPINTLKGKLEFQKKANSLLPHQNSGIYNQAIMDFGSIHCTKNNPKCIICPIQSQCLAFKLKLTKYRPVKNKNHVIKNRYFNYLFISCNNRCIIHQRGANDIWEKLYQLPLIESMHLIDERTLLLNKYIRKLNIINITPHEPITHKLSHQKLHIVFWSITVKKIKLQNEEKEINIDNIKNYPFPIPLKNYFNKQLSH